MFETSAKKSNDSWSWRNIALANLFSAWYMLLSLKTTLPTIDTNLVRIYLTEYGMDLTGLQDSDISEIGKEYYEEIQKFFIKCQIQRCENIVDRFGKVGCDPRLPHRMTLPLQCKEFFLELLNLKSQNEVISTHTKETQYLDSFLSSLIINHTYTARYRVSNNYDEWKVNTSNDYDVSPEQFSQYTDIIHKEIEHLYRPPVGVDATHESWDVVFKRIVDYIKTLIFMTSRDAMTRESIYTGDKSGSQNLTPTIFNTPVIGVWDKEELFKCATICSSNIIDTKIVNATIMPYSTLNIDHAICLFHDTNAQLDVSKRKQNANTDTFKFLCCQEYIYQIDGTLKSRVAETRPRV